MTKMQQNLVAEGLYCLRTAWHHGSFSCCGEWDRFAKLYLSADGRRMAEAISRTADEDSQAAAMLAAVKAM